MKRTLVLALYASCLDRPSFDANTKFYNNFLEQYDNDPHMQFWLATSLDRHIRHYMLVASYSEYGLQNVYEDRMGKGSFQKYSWKRIA